MAFILMVRAREWAGASAESWTYAIAGALNGTGNSDAWASAFHTLDEAREALANVRRIVGPTDAEFEISETDDV